MGRKSKIVLIGLGAMVAGLIVIPPIEYALVEQPSCLAFIGMVPRKHSPIPTVYKKEALDARQSALAQNVIRAPKPPYVIVTRTIAFGEGAAMDILVAQEETVTNDWGKRRYWRIDEANQAFDAATDAPSSTFTAQPTRVLDRSKLSRLVRKRCLFREPAIAFFPRAWLAVLDPRPRYFDGGYRFIEVNDGKRTAYFLRGARRVGIVGAIGQHLVHNAIGVSGSPNRDGSPPFRDPETEYH